MEKDQIYYSIEAELHMLRHFETCSSQSMERLRLIYTTEQIEAEINQAGSRFYKHFANDIPSLLMNLFQKQFDINVGINGNIVLSVNSDFQVGEYSIVELSGLSEFERNSIKFQNNRGLELMHLTVEKLPSTRAFVVILKPSGESYQFITAFPGVEGMPLPYDTLPEVLRKECKKYWDRHVFLERE
jgi:hypothetical protein